MNLHSLTESAVTAAKAAAVHIRSKAGRHREVLTKSEGSSHASKVVTEVDFECQQIILDILRPSIRRHGLGILTEEESDDASRHERDFFWCIDPLDGTLPFIENVAGYSVSIALVRRDGVPLIGVIADPVEHIIYHATSGSGAFLDGEPLQVTSRNPHLTLVTDRSFSTQAGHEQLLDRIRSEHGVKIINQGGAAMNALWVIANAPAVYFKMPKPEDGGGSIWDFSATACIFNELGLPATDIHGEPLQLNRRGSTFMNRNGVLYASDKQIAGFIREAARI